MKIACSKNWRIFAAFIIWASNWAFPRFRSPHICPFFWVIFGHKKPRVSCPRLALKGEFHQKGAKMEVRWTAVRWLETQLNKEIPCPLRIHGTETGIITYMIPIYLVNLPLNINLPFMYIGKHISPMDLGCWSFTKALGFIWPVVCWDESRPTQDAGPSCSTVTGRWSYQVASLVAGSRLWFLFPSFILYQKK